MYVCLCVKRGVIKSKDNISLDFRSLYSLCHFIHICVPWCSMFKRKQSRIILTLYRFECKRKWRQHTHTHTCYTVFLQLNFHKSGTFIRIERYCYMTQIKEIPVSVLLLATNTKTHTRLIWSNRYKSVSFYVYINNLSVYITVESFLDCILHV